MQLLCTVARLTSLLAWKRCRQIFNTSVTYGACIRLFSTASDELIIFSYRLHFSLFTGGPPKGHVPTLAGWSAHTPEVPLLGIKPQAFAVEARTLGNTLFVTFQVFM